ncbi:hypothetical protein [Ovoidimarina sediminis]|uniref:hypothetical protein n=1 Tax=Ovoidimarina sediminis TaxID=3079856 RepID=UPI00290C964D|nr:hypothetical protein [Rhodophyticola sp. MJ-SS7]MDU8945463.1 hypothetical protein [Rhodophyticola sp. MJ-SS7]
MFIVITLGLFSVFLANVVLGAFGGTQFMGDVGEMLVLFGASLAFVVVILQREAAAKNNNQTDT